MIWYVLGIVYLLVFFVILVIMMKSSTCQFGFETEPNEQEIVSNTILSVIWIIWLPFYAIGKLAYVVSKRI